MNSNDYKDKKIKIIMGKRAQATIFIIVAVAIVLIFVVLLLLTRGSPFVNPSETINPETYLRNCIEPSVKENVMTISKGGGYTDPKGYLEYNDEKIKYLLYH